MKIKFLSAFLVAIALSLAGLGIASAQNDNGVLVRSDGIYVRCDQCGTVERIDQNISQGGGHGTAGAVLGAIAGGVLGNQVGKGKGRDAATVAGAVGGGFAGHAIGNRGGTRNYLVHIRMGNGSYMNVQVADASSLRVGDLVQVDPNGNITRIR
ncbi:MAG TPA: glycine zipper 2TM domain-containing protein [Rhodanobacteraceae bacterium]|nr:glycine zipper 2TM domain-containing protein [Rhodanobacteraceae bacterium]